MASTYLQRTPASAGNQKTFTWSGWIKRAKLTDSQYMFCSLLGNQSRYALIRFTATDEIAIFSGLYTTGSTTTQLINLQTSAKYRDTSAWYHIVLSVDTTQATSTDRVKLYVNGNLETFDTGTGSHLLPTQNSDTFFNSTYTHRVGSFDGSIEFLDGSMSHVHWIDGTAYDASTFGETDATTGIWKPKTAPSVTYGTNGFFLKFENSANMDLDSSPNNLTFSTSGTLTQTVDTPSNVFATFNPLSKNDAGTVTFSNGNLTTAHTGTDSRYISYSTLAPSQGKWYAEFKYASTSGGSDMMVGIGDLPEVENINRQGDRFGLSGNTVGYYSSDGNKYVGPSNTISAYGNSYAVGDIIGVAMDLDNGYVYFAKNGTWQNSGDPESGASGTGGISFTTGNPFIIGSSHITTLSRETSYNGNYGNGYFGTTAVSSATSDESGLGIFEYTVPSGYYALCTKNINTQG